MEFDVPGLLGLSDDSVRGEDAWFRRGGDDAGSVPGDLELECRDRNRGRDVPDVWKGEREKGNP